MSRVRTVLPTDLVALVSYDGRVYPNEAKTWDRLGAHEHGPHPLETAIEQWFSFATGKHTWISVRGPAIRGLVSARPRAKRNAWEVDCLINADDDSSVCLSLLSRMARDIGSAGAERVFLRLCAESSLLDVVREAGFFPYARERLFRRDDPVEIEKLNALSSDVSFRPRTKAAQWGVFQLYQSAVPANVRSLEGFTLRDWQSCQERWGGRVKDLVLEEEGIITAWLRLAAAGEGRFRILLHPRYGPDPAAIVQAALARLAGRHPLLSLLPRYADQHAPILRGLGFREAAEYVLLAKRLLRGVEEMAPEKAGQAVPVS
ncbi:MAG: hypothetical protein ACE5KW_02075 [Dehalococcoidia bacterium]